MTIKKLVLFILFLPIFFSSIWAQHADVGFQTDKPWVFWYWMNASVSKEGIKADLLAMKKQGLAGAYLMPIFGKPDSLLIKPVAEQLSPVWWSDLRYAAKIADSIHLKLAFAASDGFATAGGPWITPDLSMQKVVWSETNIKGGKIFDDTLSQPETIAHYYKDIAIYAFPTPPNETISTNTIKPKVTTSIAGESADYLIDPRNTKTFSSKINCWIQYSFEKPFPCNSIMIDIASVNHQAKRLLIEVSNDGKTFHSIGRLKPSRSGWQDYVAEITYAIKPVLAKYYRFYYDPTNSEPGAEDLDDAKWAPRLKIKRLQLFGAARINQIEGKNGSVWRIADRTTSVEIPNENCISLNRIINISAFYKGGKLLWNVPKGNWTILRMGHTSTGQTNATGGGALGLECDKLNPQAVTFQFNKWFEKIYNNIGAKLSKNVIKIFHEDSWECGSQNWTPDFIQEFKKRRGYDPLPYLPIMAGFPIVSADVSERFLYDVRTTISDLLNDNFFGTLAKLAHQNNCLFTSESIAPIMLGDAMQHYGKVDIPMGEFWLGSPTHDKPNDVLDAVSGGHIYGKNIIQSEAFTELRNNWNEYPGMVKTLQDRNYALGVNRLVFHVFAENPWLERKPGMTLGGVGLFFQRDQTWWQQAKAWVAYTRRCQNLLQQGHPVNDIVVFNGAEMPRRAVLPDRLVRTMPGIYGEKRVESEQKRLTNQGNPIQNIPEGVKSEKNAFNPANWVNALNGYHYDSFNEDALLHLASVKNGNIVLSTGATYSLLILPRLLKMQPDERMSLPVAEKLLQFVKDGATILLDEKPEQTPGLLHYQAQDTKLRTIMNQFYNEDKKAFCKKLGKGRVLYAPFQLSSFDTIGLYKDVIFKNEDGSEAKDIAWNHRKVDGLKDIYFIANQKDSERIIDVSLRVSKEVPTLYDAVSNITQKVNVWHDNGARTTMKIKLEPNASLFIILREGQNSNSKTGRKNWLEYSPIRDLSNDWEVAFYNKDNRLNEPIKFPKLNSWSNNQAAAIRYYSGTAHYFKSFEYRNEDKDQNNIWLSLGKVDNIATVRVNGIDCGTVWTYPYKVNISKALKQGQNTIEIAVSNTWANRLIGDHKLPIKQRSTWTTAPYYLEGRNLLDAGLLGPIKLEVSK
ncbi:MAG TPA: glycosyl hydrolase [Arachidicoccus soli]|nr:glycosyl hydrolase [Arachidicoccus soli]